MFNPENFSTTPAIELAPDSLEVLEEKLKARQATLITLEKEHGQIKADLEVNAGKNSETWRASWHETHQSNIDMGHDVAHHQEMLKQLDVAPVAVAEELTTLQRDLRNNEEKIQQTKDIIAELETKIAGFSSYAEAA